MNTIDVKAKNMAMPIYSREIETSSMNSSILMNQSSILSDYKATRRRIINTSLLKKKQKMKTQSNMFSFDKNLKIDLLESQNKL